MEAATGQPMYFQVVRPGGDGGGDARELLSMQAFQLQDGASFEALASSSTSAGREDDGLRRRVMRLCMISAAFLVVHALVNNFINLAMFEDVLRIVHEVTDVRAPSFFLIAVGSLKGLISGLALALLVQTCGYCGAKHSRPCPLASFACCSFLNCCACTGWLCCLSVVLLILQVGGPQIQSELVRCDPLQCMPRGNLTEPAFVVDCLAAGVWDEKYVRRFGPERYPSNCPKEVLDCDSRAVGEGSPPSEPVHWLRRGLASRPPMASTDASPRMGEKPPPMPSDVLGSCKVDEGKVIDMHVAAVALPELMPQVLIWLYVKVAILIPVVVLGCLGFCWGTAMYDKAFHSRPGGLPSQHQIILQPVLGSLVAAGRPRDATMVQPLMRSPMSEAPL